LQALLSRPYPPQESLKISMPYLPPGKTGNWPDGRARVILTIAG
jgi:hypothetical protein